MGLSLLLVLLIAAASAQRGQKIASLPSWQSAQPLPNMESGYINLNVQVRLNMDQRGACRASL